MTEYLLALNAFFAGILLCCVITDKGSRGLSIPAFVLCFASVIAILCEQEEDVTKLELFRKEWVGRKFKCKKTGEELTIPENVRECEFFSFGECFIDVGRYGFYSRAGGEFEEIVEENS